MWGEKILSKILCHCADDPVLWMCECERDSLTFSKAIPRHCRHLIHFLFGLHHPGDLGSAVFKIFAILLFQNIYRYIFSLFMCV